LKKKKRDTGASSRYADGDVTLGVDVGQWVNVQVLSGGAKEK